MVRLVATHRRLGRVACRVLDIDRHRGRNRIVENNLYAETRLRQYRNLVNADQLTGQPDGVHEEDVYGGLVLYVRPQKTSLHAWV